MEDDDLEQKIKSLQNEVNQITSSGSTNSVKKETKQFAFNFDMLNTSIISYAIIPCLIAAVLFASKPSLLLEDNTSKTNDRKFSYKKLIVATIISTIAIKTIIIVGVIVYKNQRSN